MMRLSAVLFLAAFLLVLSFMGLVDDTLFFHSDVRSLFALTIGLTLPVFAILILLAAGWRLLKGTSAARLTETWAAGVAALIATDLLFFLLDVLDREFRIFGLFRKLDAEYLFFLLWAVLFAIFGFFIFRARSRAVRAERIVSLALPLSPAALALFIGLIGYERLIERPRALAQPPRHVVLAILDGWPAKQMRAYFEGAPERSIDPVFEQGRVFTNVHTSAAWTNAYFGTLYSCRQNFAFRRMRLRDQAKTGVTPPVRNLFSALQDLDVRTRWLTFHRNGVPEASASGVNAYKGLRSIFLSGETTWLPGLLGLDHNIVIPNRASRTIRAGGRRDWLFEALIGERPFENLLTQLLLPQLRQIRERTNRSFTLFHSGWGLGVLSVTGAWDETGKTKVIAAKRRIRARDYRYLDDEEWYADYARGQYNDQMEKVSKKIGDFLDALRAEGLDKDTLVIFTADHGSINERNRMWYGFHPDEEVTRVPFVVLGGGTGRDSGSFNTLDICRTLISHFGGGESLHARSKSMFGGEARELATSITMRSDKNREWWLLLYRGGRKYGFNLHPESAGEAVEYSLDGYDQKEVGRGEATLEKIGADLKESLLDYDLHEADIHARYKAMVE